MTGPIHRRRPTAQEYRLRRAIAASAVVIVLGLGWQLLGPGGSGKDASPPTTSSSTSTTLPPLPACTVGEVPSTQDPKQDWASILVDTNIAIPASYGPGDLHNIADAGFPLTDGLALRGFVMDDLSDFRQAAIDNGTPIKVLAAYRSYPTQQDLFTRRVDELGGSEAGSRVARPGHSEHQLGTTLDITSEGLSDVDQAWGASKTGQWVASNAFKYGFIVSYPAGASTTTCYDFEPWHLRYVGIGTATSVIEAGVTLREYLWDLQQQGAPANAR